MDNSSDFKIIEVGGTIGDDESLIFLRALQSMKYEDNENMIFVLLAPVIFNEAVGEPKTKIIQNSCKQLLEMGIKPDFVVARVDDTRRLDDKRKRKIATFCFVNEENIIVDPDISNIYEMPLIFSNQSFGQKILSYFNITRGHETLAQHSELIKSYQTSKNGPTVKIGYVGKYVTEGGMVHKDAYISVDESIRRACAEAGVNPEVVRINSEDIERDGTGVLESVDGIIVPGGYGSRGLDGKIQAVQFARENKIPFLGLCLGMQMAVIEFARNVCGMTSAHSDEMHDAGEKCNDDHIITILPDQEKIRKNEGFIGTQRLGDYVCYLNDDTIKDMYTLVGRPDENEKARIEIFKQEKSVRLGVSQDSMYPIIERHRHRREVNPKVIEKLKSNGMNFPGIHISLNGEILAEIISLKDHPFFYASQFHPEFTTNYMRPNPLFYGFVKTIGDKKRIVDEIKTKA